MQKVEAKIASIEKLSELDLEVVTAGKGTVGIAQRTVTPYLELIGNQAGFSLGESIGRSLTGGGGGDGAGAGAGASGS